MKKNLVFDLSIFSRFNKNKECAKCICLVVIYNFIVFFGIEKSTAEKHCIEEQSS